jgi:vacuolar iron transporter family protein
VPDDAARLSIEVEGPGLGMAHRIETSHPRQHAPAWWWNIREIILGANDGLVSTLAFVACAVASLPDPDLIALATLMEVIAGAISMGFGAYLGARSRTELERRELAVERVHLRERRDEEREELERFLAKHELSGDEVKQLSTLLQRDENLLLSVMGALELGVQIEPEPPVRAGMSMAAAFVVGSLPPALPFLLIEDAMTALAIAVSASLLFLIGVGLWRARIGDTRKRRTITEMVVLGVIATAAGYGLGHAVAWLLG